MIMPTGEGTMGVQYRTHDSERWLLIYAVEDPRNYVELSPAEQQQLREALSS